MIIWPGLRRSVSAIQRLFNSASVSLPLTHTAVPTRGSITPTFVRASTATFRDWEGVLRTVPSGCARFEGARMVRNLLAGSSENLTNAAWGNSSVSLVANAALSPRGDATASKVIPTAVNATVYQLVSGKLMSGYGKADGIGWIAVVNVEGTQAVAWFNLTTGQLGTIGVGYTATIESDQNGFYRWSLIKDDLTPFTYYQVLVTDGDNTTSITPNGTDGVLLWGAQLEDVTGQADQTASEYVSVGVLSDPWHGAGVDGVEFFNTDRGGAVIPAATNTGYLAESARTNLCLQSNAFTTTWAAAGTPAATQNVIGPDGATSAWTLTDDNPAATEGVYQFITHTAATHTFSLFVKKVTSTPTSYPVLFVQNVGGSLLAITTIDNVSGVANVWTASTYVMFSVTTSSATCVSHNDDFWRVSLTYLATAEQWLPQIYVAGSTVPYALNTQIEVAAQGSAVFYGAQVELGSFATPYIPTTTVAVARNADVDQYPTTDGPIAAAGSIALDFTPYHAPSGTIALWGTYVDASNYTAILHDATNLIFRKRIAGSNYDATIANAFVSGTTYKVAATWGAAGTAIYLDGVAGTPHANTTAAQIAATMQVGADGNSLQQPGAGTTNLRIWQRQLSSPEGVAVTA